MEDIIGRGVIEIKKNVFGNGSGERKSTAWTRQQAWSVVKALAATDQVWDLQLIVFAKNLICDEFIDQLL